MPQQSTTPPRTVVAKSGMIVPATITAQDDFNTMDTACIVFHRLNEYKVACDTLAKAKSAMRDASAIVTLYADAKGNIAARCLWPSGITLTKDNAITCEAYCTLRREYRSFRLDRIIACHELTTPDDCDAGAEEEPDQAWEDSPPARSLYR